MKGWLSGCVLACLLLACGDEETKLTQIVVLVDSDLAVPDQLDNVQIEVSGTKDPRVIDAPVDTEEHKLPASLGLVYSGGPLGPVRVTARGQRDGETIVERTAEVHFKKERTLKLMLPLSRSCLELPPCEGADQTCDRGTCVSTAINLPAFDGNDGSFLTDGGRGWVPDGDAAMADGGTMAAADSGADSGSDAGVADAAPAPTPTCTIDTPADGAKFYEGDPISFAGSCTGPEGQALEALWESAPNGRLGTGNMLERSDLPVGTQEISLCAGGTSTCTGTRQINVMPLPEVSATISSLAQQGATDNTFRADAELIVKGDGTGVPPLELTWTDSIAGEVASGSSFTMSMLLPARHTLRLVVKDGRGRTATAERIFTVRAPGRTTLFETYDLANSVLNSYGTVKALASDGAFHYVGTEAGYLLQVAADTAEMMSPSVTPTALSVPRPELRGLFVHSSSNTLYLATSADVQSCDITNGAVKNCAKLTLGNIASAIPRCVRRFSNEGTDYLMVGTSAGLWLGANNALANGSLRDQNAEFNAATESSNRLWMAGSAGLSGYVLGSGSELAKAPKKYAGASSGLLAIAASGGNIWAALSGGGITRYELPEARWTSWTTSYTDAEFGRLVDNDVRSVAITRPVVDGVAHDVIWVGTGAGLSRFDPAVPSFTTYTKADGLPDNQVLRVVGLPSNELLLATPSGLAIHRGQ